MAAEIARVVAASDAKLERYRAASEAGTDPTLVATWTATVHAERASALSRARPLTSHKQLSRDEIKDLVAALESVPAVLLQADPADKEELYHQLGLKLTYAPADRLVRANVEINARAWGYGACPEGDMNHNPTIRHRVELRIQCNTPSRPA